MIVCLCRGVSDCDIRALAGAGCRTPGAIAQACGAGADCGACRALVGTLIVEDAGADAYARAGESTRCLAGRST